VTQPRGFIDNTFFFKPFSGLFFSSLRDWYLDAGGNYGRCMAQKKRNTKTRAFEKWKKKKKKTL
jgi:hypothetical protein